ncbi:Aste57867_18840 [Aphanomyces stellatus]|uniref:Aste57867_18840 protein n=1 Tax=Aphanomyces stellatus TaxID=120398 RepID=A0A485LBR1_9STRA|nr:hypothetical protein As57867_018776 [Aphanomyces stellatus]VFT95574.1 Aste57867_18840 [Aphanomyces stellatus]
MESPSRVLSGLKRRRLDMMSPVHCLPSLSLMLKRDTPPEATSFNPTPRTCDNDNAVGLLDLLGAAAQMRSPIIGPAKTHPRVMPTATMPQVGPRLASISLTSNIHHRSHHDAMPQNHITSTIDSRIPQLRGSYGLPPSLPGLPPSSFRPVVAPPRSSDLTREDRVARWKAKRQRQHAAKVIRDGANPYLQAQQKIAATRKRIHGRFASTDVYIPITALQN